MARGGGVNSGTHLHLVPSLRMGEALYALPPMPMYCGQGQVNLCVFRRFRKSAKSGLTLYAPCVILQCVDEPTRCTTSYK